MGQGELIYIASPYSVVNKEELDKETIRDIHHSRYVCVTDYAAHLASQRRLFYAPITMTHPLIDFGAPEEWDYWIDLDRPFMQMCNVLHVLMLDDWEKSKGVAVEIDSFLSRGLPVYYINKNTYEEYASHVTRAKRGS